MCEMDRGISAVGCNKKNQGGNCMKKIIVFVVALMLVATSGFCCGGNICGNSGYFKATVENGQSSFTYTGSVKSKKGYNNTSTSTTYKGNLTSDAPICVYGCYGNGFGLFVSPFDINGELSITKATTHEWGTSVAKGFEGAQGGTSFNNVKVSTYGRINGKVKSRTWNTGSYYHSFCNGYQSGSGGTMSSIIVK